MTRDEATLLFLGRLEVLRHPSGGAAIKGYAAYPKEAIEMILQNRAALVEMWKNGEQAQDAVQALEGK